MEMDGDRVDCQPRVHQCLRCVGVWCDPVGDRDFGYVHMGMRYKLHVLLFQYNIIILVDVFR